MEATFSSSVIMVQLTTWERTLLADTPLGTPEDLVTLTLVQMGERFNRMEDINMETTAQ